jgi:hypothetical protein
MISIRPSAIKPRRKRRFSDPQRPCLVIAPMTAAHPRLFPKPPVKDEMQ